MESSFNFDNVKAEKTQAMLRYNRLRKIGNLFRLIELFVALFLFSWFTFRLPFAFKISTDYFRQLYIVLFSPRFVFFVGNLIVVTLFVKSGQFSGQGSNSAGGSDLYDEFVMNRVHRHNVAVETPVFQDKEIVCEAVDTVVVDRKVFRRSQSEDMKKSFCVEKPKRELRRAETEVRRKVDVSDECVSDSDEEMSNEEFQRKIEAFIAKQVKFHRQESMAIVELNLV
ncbi:hypothetical protein GIB67_005557 [Kingdonia uniflora]|uniref:DUF4408 domain-containing protein n=1 Tax=Kingdonia uniflora TaxID=39325 RepID=A0A7J7NHN1_9MAGN|nr:hypothetical protein GIB67_005557 [Kingdonia uniflora]